MLDHVSYLYGFNLDRARELVKELNADQMVQQPNGVVNHPAWTLGHLTLVSDALGQALGLDSALPAGWDEKFNAGGIPSADVSAYPSKDELLAALAAQHVRNTEAVEKADPSVFSKPHPNEKTRKKFPTMGDLIVFLMTSHEMSHLGQVAAWRRAMGLGSATGI